MIGKDLIRSSRVSTRMECGDLRKPEPVDASLAERICLMGVGVRRRRRAQGGGWYFYKRNGC